MKVRGACGSAAVTTTTTLSASARETWTAVLSSRIDSVNGVATFRETGRVCVWL